MVGDMSVGRMWRILLALGLVLSQCQAILYASETIAKSAICDSDICKCTSRGDIAITCTCGTTGTQEVDLQGTYQPHPNTNNFVIENCRRVTVNANTFASLQNLHRVELRNIAQIVLKENAFNWKSNDTVTHEQIPLSFIPSGLLVWIVNSSIPVIPTFAFKGRLELISMRDSHIGTVSAFAFTNLRNTLALEFINTNFNNLEAQAFKKFMVETITLSGGRYGSIPSRTMVDIDVVKTLRIDKVFAETVRSSAFVVSGVEAFKIDGCRFTRVEGDAFRVVTRSPTHIENSVFVSVLPGAFAGITVGNYVFSKQGHQKLYFRNNNITHFESGALVFNITRIDPQLDKITIEQPCSCNWTVPLTITHRPSSLRQSNKDASTDKDSTVFWCKVDDNKSNPSYKTFQEYNEASCGVKTSEISMALIIIITLLLLVLVIGVVVLCFIRCRRRRVRNQKWKNVPTENPTYEQDTRKFGKKNKKGKPDGRIVMVVPDGRMYRETELHVIVEQAEPISDHEHSEQNHSDHHIYQNLPVAEPPIPAGQKPVPRPRTKLA